MIRAIVGLVVAILSAVGLWFGPSDIELNNPPSTLPATVYTTPGSPPVMPAERRKPTPTTTTTVVPDSALCGEWWIPATVAGWNIDDLPTLDRIMWNESRCENGLMSDTNDVGLTQLNVHTHADMWEADGWTTDDIRHNPVLNLIYARRVADLATSYGWCQWEPWHGYSGNYCQ